MVSCPGGELSRWGIDVVESHLGGELSLWGVILVGVVRFGVIQWGIVLEPVNKLVY